MQENTKQVAVKMTARRCFRTEPIYQYDVGHVLSFEGFELPASFEVHFSRSPMGKAIPQIGTDGVCTVPEMFTQDAGIIYAWLYIADTDSRLTKYSIEIPVAKRAKPTNQQPTPVEQSAIDQAIAALNDGVERSETAADAAESAQEAAEGYAEAAGNSAITATNAATSAAASAGNAASSATAAASSATDANSSREAADQSATNAGVSERAAASSASAAASSASSASQSASSASMSASSASEAAGAAVAAKGAAETAQAAAEAAMETATESAADASESATTATGAATNAAASAASASASATAAAGSATAAAQSAQEVAEVAEELPGLIDDVDSLKSAFTEHEQYAEDTYAKQDGYYQDMAVGTAEQLVSSKFVEDQEPYTLRASGGSADIGNRENLTAIVGGTLAWNQLVDYDSINSPITVAGITYSMTGNGKISANGTSTGETAFFLSPDGTNKGNTTYKKDHVYLLKGCPTGGAGTKYYLSWSLSGDDIGSGNVKKATADVNSGYVYIRVRTGVEVSNLVFVPQLFDLTLMFGSAVADYIYNLETANPGAGVALFRKWFPNGYYEYNPGELKSVEGLQSHDTVGFNLWDEEWRNGYYSTTGQFVSNSSYVATKNPIRVIPGETYCLYSASGSLGRRVFYDANMNFVSSDTIGTGVITKVIPANVQYMQFDMTSAYGNKYKNDICLSLAHSGSRNGEYEPYEKHSYPLDSSVVLRGIPKAGANGIYWDGDQYLPDGTVERRYGVVDLGSLTWGQSGTLFQANVSLGQKEAGNAAHPSYKPYYSWASFTSSSNSDLSIFVGSTAIFVKNSPEMPSGILVYELATPTTETAEPFRELQIVDDWGTEEFVSTGLVPVGHTTQYPANLRDKLQHLPDLASGNGIYIVKQTDSEMELMRLPDMPTANGNYRLKLNVASGSPTFSWEVVT